MATANPPASPDNVPAAPHQGATAPPLEAPKKAPPPRNRAKEIIDAKRRSDAEKQRAQDEQDNAERVYYLTCPRVAGHMAAFLTEKMAASGILEAENWEHLLHTPGQPWLRPYIPCQECLAEGEERFWNARLRPLRRRESDGSFSFVIVDRKFAVASTDKATLGIRKDKLAAVAGKGAR